MLLQKLEQEHHVWFIVPESIQNTTTLESYLAILSEEEQSHYRRFHFATDRQRYLVSHAMVRHVLSRYAAIAPGDWHFERTRHGRPEIANSGIPALRFNLTHTHGLAACIVTLTEPCGIDAEQLDQRHNLLGVAKRMFSPLEYEQLSHLDGRTFLDDFYTRWTLREAYVKARGIGISFPTRKLMFDIHADNEIGFMRQADIDDDRQGWRFTILRPLPDHVAAVAVGNTTQTEKNLVTRFFEFPTTTGN